MSELLVCPPPEVLILLETRNLSNRAQRVVNARGFDGFCAIEARGFAGGIWCF